MDVYDQRDEAERKLELALEFIRETWPFVNYEGLSFEQYEEFQQRRDQLLK